MIRDLSRSARRSVASTATVVLGVVGMSMFGLPGAALAQGDRAYELVTPPGAEPEVRFSAGLSTPYGEMACFNAEESFAGAPENGNSTFDDGYCARRTASGWETEWVTGPAPSGQRRGNFGSQVVFLSPDGERVAFGSDAGIFPDWGGGIPGSPVWGTPSAFMREGGQTRWLAPTPHLVREVPAVGDYGYSMPRLPVAASDDLRHGLFQSTLRLLPEDENDYMDLYKWTPDGIEVVSRDDSGSAVGGYAPLGREPEQVRPAPGSISADGSRVFFMAPAVHTDAGPPPEGEGAPPGVRSIFMLEGDEVTHISRREGPGPAADVFMEGAYDDQSVVYLSTTEQLTDEPKASCNAEPCGALYRYDMDTDELSLFATHAEGIVFLGASDDGETVLYRTNGAAAQELLVRRDGVETSLGMLGPIDTSYIFDAVASTRPDKRALRIAHDGSSIVFASFGGFDGAPFMTRQVFRWTPAGGVEWISRDEAGTAAGLAAIGNYSTKFPDGLPRFTMLDIYGQGANTGRVISDDGSRVFFETTDALVEGDENNVVDVYEWHDGQVSLVSPGTQSEDAFYHDSSPDGSTVFFMTRSRLIPELDRGNARDLYAARVGGGFPLPEVVPDCVGEECQGPPSSPPAAPGRPGSDAVQGSGDASERRVAPTSFSVSALSANQRRLLAAGRKATLPVRVGGAGRVRAALFAPIGDRRTRVAAAGRVASRRGTVRLTLRLSSSARAVLRRRGALRLSLEVTHSKSKRIVRKVVVLHD